jgi:predicted Zn finger-like uncharacterized protein
MKFTCDRCDTRYSIGDEKVRGKVLKIRCKTCGNIMVVREAITAVQGEASTFQAQQQVAASGGSAGATVSPFPVTATPVPSVPQRAAVAEVSRPVTDIDWYMAMKGKQHGPAKFDEIVRLLRDGKITERTYLWHDGLAAWTRLKELADFAGQFDAQGQVKRPPPPPADEAPAAPEGNAKVVNLEEARAQLRGYTAPGAVTADPFGAVGSLTGSQDAPRESTRVFIMNAGLHEREQSNRRYAAAAALIAVAVVGVCAVDYKYDVLGLKQVMVAVAEKTGMSEPPELKRFDDTDVDPTIKCKLNPNPDECVKQELAARKVRGGRRGGTKEVGIGSGEPIDMSGQQVGGGAGAGTVVGAGVDGAAGLNLTALSDADRAALKNLGQLPGGPKAPTGPSGVEVATVATVELDQKNIAKTVSAGNAAVQDCVEKAMKVNEDIPGRLTLTISLRPNGTVEGARTNNAVVNASGLGSCLSSAARKWKFAPFGGNEVVDIQAPLVLR